MRIFWYVWKKRPNSKIILTAPAWGHWSQERIVKNYRELHIPIRYKMKWQRERS